ncbi:hypothetical protein NPIL_604401 [Nephila pilipes]|uniref:Uncharacterized protein n=1 Tax=Nephila pilipes TaxID=299642 RepID=A0A8X6MUG8_NEPPI|nr:hypothetical protein NPIL_604401 [Nephila pilipes]
MSFAKQSFKFHLDLFLYISHSKSAIAVYWPLICPNKPAMVQRRFSSTSNARSPPPPPSFHQPWAISYTIKKISHQRSHEKRVNPRRFVPFYHVLLTRVRLETSPKKNSTSELNVISKLRKVENKIKIARKGHNKRHFCLGLMVQRCLK